MPTQQNYIPDPWGDLVMPGEGEPLIWATIPDEDKIEDLMGIVKGERSFGPQKDRAFMYMYESSGRDPMATIRKMTEYMNAGTIPHVWMWESPSTELGKYKNKRMTGIQQ